MVNFRYHIISLTAIFLALGIGLALGAAFIDRATLDTLNDSITDLEDERRDLRNQISELEREVGLHEQLIEEGGLQLLSGHLTEVPVVILAVRGIDEAPVEATRDAIVAAGAVFGGTLWLTDRAVLDDDEERVDLATALGVDDVDAEDLHRMLGNRLGNVLAAAGEQVIDEPPGVDAPAVTPEPELLSDLRAAGFLEFDAPLVGPDGFEVLPAAGARYVVISGRGGVVPDDLVLLPLVERLASGAGEPAVVAAEAIVERDDSEEPVVSAFVAVIRDDEALRADVSTVDNLDAFAGQEAVVLALAHLANGQVGHYGVRDGADTLVPPPVEGE